MNNQLQWKLIYSVVVAGKSATFADGAMARLFDNATSPLSQMANWLPDEFESRCRLARTGNYSKLVQFLKQFCIAEISLTTCNAEELEKLHGVGPKTSRFFLLWTRNDANHAALDVHILRWLSNLGYKVPTATPQSGTRYAVIEQHFLHEAKKRNVTPRILDHAVWVEGAKHHECTEFTAALIRPWI